MGRDCPVGPVGPVGPWLPSPAVPYACLGTSDFKSLSYTWPGCSRKVEVWGEAIALSFQEEMSQGTKQLARQSLELEARYASGHQSQSNAFKAGKRPSS